jgi:hypothetical protein
VGHNATKHRRDSRFCSRLLRLVPGIAAATPWPEVSAEWLPAHDRVPGAMSAARPAGIVVDRVRSVPAGYDIKGINIATEKEDALLRIDLGLSRTRKRNC